MTTALTYDACLEKIEYLREQMINAAKKYGMTHPLVLDYSQKLDRAHNIAMMHRSAEKTNWNKEVFQF
ncbi:aspartyl-phosphate phosphatase Spo0E family protein [Alkalihalophilus lindianensis]|uniref:Aspartyl-phosphate phosphatase Spo0E family protein n=1 Tax=Alkalihalophilus lindianensis TaxID=1630542 RepID=A0ABU3X9Y9_9BACI|nr:aspartyl-phosphate phosphatase Spo0E family protein [Alkalihalophilus lindianensis]MDV2684123.1 aspartyl-phosphate phosphatase Spo0E family protein [Alkalihalophilus lindianensis]